MFSGVSKAHGALRMKAPIATVSPLPSVPLPFTEKESLFMKDNPSVRAFDNRGLCDCRKIFIQSGMVANASGSGYLEVGDTQVIASVFGPKPAHEFQETANIDVQIHYSPFSAPAFQKRVDFGDASSKAKCEEMSRILTTTLKSSICLDKYPKSVIVVNIEVVQDGGAVLACAMNCVSIALLDAGVAMKDIFAACHVARISNSIIVDPCRAEENAQDASLILAYQPQAQKVIQILSWGRLSPSQMKESMSLGIEGCCAICSYFSATMKKEAKKSQSKHP